jgi:hypothetical protein
MNAVFQKALDEERRRRRVLFAGWSAILRGPRTRGRVRMRLAEKQNAELLSYAAQSRGGISAIED